MSDKKSKVLITGGTGGLGEAVTRDFLNGQSIVAVSYTRERTFSDMASRLEADPSRLIGVAANVLDSTSVDAMVHEVEDRLGGIDTFIHLVGGYLGGVSIQDTGDEQWFKMMSLNLTSVFFCCRAVLSSMIRAGSGTIITIGTKSALRGESGTAAYSASKSALINFTESLAAEGKKHDIRANVVIPSIIDTPANRSAMPSANFSHWVAPSSIARVLRFLASAEARDISGSVVPVYGRT